MPRQSLRRGGSQTRPYRPSAGDQLVGLLFEEELLRAAIAGGPQRPVIAKGLGHVLKVVGVEDLDVASEFESELHACAAAQGKNTGGAGTSSNTPPNPVPKKKANDDFDY